MVKAVTSQCRKTLDVGALKFSAMFLSMVTSKFAENDCINVAMWNADIIPLCSSFYVMTLSEMYTTIGSSSGKSATQLSLTCKKFRNARFVVVPSIVSILFL